MSSVILAGDTSGTITLAAPAVAGSNTITLPAVTGTTVIAGQNSAITAGTSQASTSGTSIDFTSIPSWVKRITVMFNGVSTNGTSNYLIRIGSGSVTTSGYSAGAAYCGTAQSFVASTAGFVLNATTAAQAWSGTLVIALSNSSTFVYTQSGNITDASAYAAISGGTITLSGILDRVRITTVNGTDTFDAGSINILYE